MIENYLIVNVELGKKDEIIIRRISTLDINNNYKYFNVYDHQSMLEFCELCREPSIKKVLYGGTFLFRVLKSFGAKLNNVWCIRIADAFLYNNKPRTFESLILYYYGYVSYDLYHDMGIKAWEKWEDELSTKEKLYLKTKLDYILMLFKEQFNEGKKDSVLDKIYMLMDLIEKVALIKSKGISLNVLETLPDEDNFRI